jgi:hypothetical protein
MNEFEQAAELYLSLGLKVIALTGKQPNGTVHEHGLHDALAGDPGDLTGRIRLAFTHKATTGIGILTSYPYVVVDIDGEEGAEQWRSICPDDYIPERWVAKTSRGLHLWFADFRPRTTKKLGPKLDLKGEGGYVAAPPSLHPDGHVYEWLAGPEGPPMEIPDELAKVLDDLEFKAERRDITREQYKHVRHEPKPGVFYASWGFEGILDAMREAPEGNRNAVLHWAACTLEEDGADAQDFEELEQAALGAGLGRREVRLTIRSGRRKVQAKT